jgi:hypothetical protein
MPYISTETEIDLSVDEFLDECSSKEIKELIEALIEDGHIPKLNSPGVKLTYHHSDFSEKMNELSSKYLSIDNDDLEIIEKLFKKYL